MQINSVGAITWTPRDLDVFLALAASGGFRRAAEQVHLSQSAVSGVIARLEDSLGVRLFDRNTRSVSLTPCGEVFLEQARLLRAQFDEAARRVRAMVQLRAGRVSLAALPSLAATVLPRVMAEFARLYPGVELNVRDTLSGAAFELVRSGQVDLAITAANPEYADLDYTALTADSFVLLCAADHRLARSRKPLQWSEVVGERHISMPLPASVRQYANAAFLFHGFQFAPAYEVEHIATIHGMVRAGLGVAALPELAAAFVGREGMVTRRLTGPDMQRPIGLVSRRGRSLSPAAAEMIRLLREEIAHLLPAGRTGPVAGE
ncbi:MAG: LysR family transcriptional regulator [Burkholderiales bacterium]|nr:LysR family transcriptional regulator [Burkholderiales bacterium]